MDIRQDPEVMRVYWEMFTQATGMTQWTHKIGRIRAGYCDKCGKHLDRLPYGRCEIPDPITMSVADLAFWMRDKCDPEQWEWELVECYFGNQLNMSFAARARVALHQATPKQWIYAAVKAWRQKNASD